MEIIIVETLGGLNKLMSVELLKQGPQRAAVYERSPFSEPLLRSKQDEGVLDNLG